MCLNRCFIQHSRLHQDRKVWRYKRWLIRIGKSQKYRQYNDQNKMNCDLMLTHDTPAYMFNVYKNQLSRQTGSRNLTGPKTLPTIWHTYMKLVTKYQIFAISWEKWNEIDIGMDRRMDRGKTVYPPPPPVERGV